MTGDERRRALAEVDEAMTVLARKGWRIDLVETRDRDTRPFRVRVTLSTELYDREPDKGVC